ncbi:MAG: hypothetical protein ACLUD2_18065 [Clostridium sp.]
MPESVKGYGRYLKNDVKKLIGGYFSGSVPHYVCGSGHSGGWISDAWNQVRVS